MLDADIDYHSNFPVKKRMEGLSTENLTATTKVIFAEYRILHRLMSDAGTNFISERFRRFCSRINIEQAVSLEVQEEDGGPRTHGTIIGKGDHNHHNCTYDIQITIMGSRITCNGQHIRPTTIAAEDYICYQAKNILTDKLIHWILSWNTLKSIHNHTPRRSPRAITMAAKTYMMNNKQKTICKEMDRNACKKF